VAQVTNKTLKNCNFFGVLRIILSLSLFGIFLPQSVFPQQEGRKTIEGKVEQPKPSRGIEKKDIRLVILYDEDETPSMQAEEVARTAAVDAIASGAKLTKADAARQKPVEQPLSSNLFQAIFPQNSSVVFFAAKQKGGDCVPPVDCGCDKGPIDCVCIVWRKTNGELGCLCRLCFLDLRGWRVEWQTQTNAGTARIDRGQNEQSAATIFIVLGEKLQLKLADKQWWERNRDWFNKEVWQKVQLAPTTTNLVIKTKSSPP
jgi:hypothetical protein